mmetsp:Transcript_8336/g.30794  ORF Transcript_8336/g.30794 Transcript_8336/m.30794 type:complete len:312 (-) Transcript_8336:46-981(-)
MTTPTPDSSNNPSISSPTTIINDPPSSPPESSPINVDSLTAVQKMQLLLQIWHQRKYNQLNPLKQQQIKIFNEEYATNQQTTQLNSILDSYVKIKREMNISDQVTDLKMKMLHFRRDHQNLVRDLKFIHEELLPYMESRQQYSLYNKWKNDRRHEILDLKEQKRLKVYALEEQKIKAKQQRQLHNIKVFEKQLDSAKRERELKQKRMVQMEKERIEREQDVGHQLRRIQEEKERIKKQIQEEKERKMKALQEKKRKEREEQLKREAEERMKKEMEEMEELKKQLEALKQSNEDILDESTTTEPKGTAEESK